MRTFSTMILYGERTCVCRLYFGCSFIRLSLTHTYTRTHTYMYIYALLWCRCSCCCCSIFLSLFFFFFWKCTRLNRHLSSFSTWTLQLTHRNTLNVMQWNFNILQLYYCSITAQSRWMYSRKSRSHYLRKYVESFFLNSCPFFFSIQFFLSLCLCWSNQFLVMFIL